MGEGISCIFRDRGGSQFTTVLKLAVFDFDSTLTSYHVFSSLSGSTTSKQKLSVPPPYARTERGQIQRLLELDADPNWGHGKFALMAFGGESRLSRLRHLLEVLRDSGVECIILSRGMVGPIRMCLKQVDLLQFFARVFGNVASTMGATDYDRSVPFSYGADVGGPIDDIGGAHVSKSGHIRQYMGERGLELQEVVFVEDEAAELQGSRSICECFHVASSMGMQEHDFRAILQMLSKAPRLHIGDSTSKNLHAVHKFQSVPDPLPITSPRQYIGSSYAQNVDFGRKYQSSPDPLPITSPRQYIRSSYAQNVDFGRKYESFLPTTPRGHLRPYAGC